MTNEVNFWKLHHISVVQQRQRLYEPFFFQFENHLASLVLAASFTLFVLYTVYIVYLSIHKLLMVWIACCIKNF